LKKGLLIIALLMALVVAVVLTSVALAGGVRFDFQIEPGCVVEIYPLWEPGERGGIVFNRGRASWEDNPPFITLNGEASYDIDLWCPGIAPTYQGTIHVANIAAGQQDIWFPLHEAELGVFYKGWWVTIDAEEPEYICNALGAEYVCH